MEITIIKSKKRQLLLIEESENYSIFSKIEREELLFRIFSHFVCGGSMCQYEDSISPYLEITKECYKALVRSISFVF